MKVKQIFNSNRYDNCITVVKCDHRNGGWLMFYYSMLVSKSTEDGTKKLACSCGKNHKDSQDSCVRSKEGHTRCPCAGAGVPCSRDCRCKGCKNKKECQELDGAESHVSCKCGVDKVKKDPKYVACRDGKRKTKCRCVRYKTQCGPNCLCRNCGNCDKSSNSRSLIQRSFKRKRENPSPYKKKSSAEFLASKGRHPSAGPWTTHEKCLLLSCISLIRATAVNPTVENITSLYNNVINSDVRKHTGYPMREKSITQVSRKLAHLGEKQAVLNVLRNSGH